MEDLYASLTEALAAWVRDLTGAPVAPADFRLPRAVGRTSLRCSSLRHSSLGQLSLGVFVTGGTSAAEGARAAARLNASLCPQIRAVGEKNGWLLFYLSDAWFDGLIAWAKGLDTRPAGSYVENRMAVLARKGDAPCPDWEDVRRALWAAYLAYRRGAWRESDERLALTMTHALSGMDRIALENRCGGAAAAIGN